MVTDGQRWMMVRISDVLSIFSERSDERVHSD